MLLAGLDIGTTGCKVTVYHPEGEYLGRVYRDYPHARSAAGHEVDAAQIWEAARTVLAEAAAKWPGIGGIGVTSFGESFVLLSENDEPLQNVMLYTDPRGAEECAALTAAVGADRLARIAGVKPHPMYAAPKLMWVKNHRPEIWAKTKRIFQMEDYVVYLLSGTAQIDYSLATRTMAFDIRALAWQDDVLAAAGIDRALLPKPVPIGTRAGTVKPGLAVQLGLGANTLVVSAGQDQVAAAVGSGVFSADMAVDGAGTVECITPVFQSIPSSGGFAEGGYAVVPYVEKGQYVCYAFSFTGGAAVKWFTDNLAGYAAADAARQGIDIYRALKSDVPLDRPTGLMVLPHFAGAATPYMDTGSKGAILGLTLETTQADIFCAIMEGVCFEMRLNKEKLNAAGISFSSLRATGGGANSRAWMQMKADVLGLPVTSLQTAEAGGAGAAMMAGVAAGIWPSLPAAAQTMVQERERFTPRAHLQKMYDDVYRRYTALYSAVRPLV